MINFVCTPPCLRFTLIVAMETMQFFIVLLSLSLGTKILGISVVPINDFAPIKIVLEVQRYVKLAPGLPVLEEKKNACPTYARMDARPDKTIYFDPST